MLTIINGADAQPVDYDGYFITQKYDGMDELQAELPVDHPAYPAVMEEICIEDREENGTVRYLVKAIDEGEEMATIKCQIDLDDLRADMLLSYHSGSHTVADIVAAVLPAGWTVQDHAALNIRRTIELEAATPLEIIQACKTTFDVVTRYDNVGKVVHIYNPADHQPTGAYATEELNLRAVNYKGSSRDFATRLYAVGKDGMTFASVNEGKAYVDDHTYSDKVVSAYWKDERYTIPENLLADAKRNLAMMAIPTRSYECDVVDLAKIDPERYAYNGFALYDVITLLDARRGTRVDHMVVECKIYPHYPENNVITLSTTAPKIQNTVRQIQQQIDCPTSQWRQIIQAAIQTATEWIAGMLGGHYIVTTDPQTGLPNGWAVMDTDDPATAQKVWRATLGGIGYSGSGFNGPFELALTADGAINASMITTGVLTANVIRAGKLQSILGGMSIDVDSGQIKSKNGAYELEIWSGEVTAKKNGKTTVEIYSAGDPSTFGVVNVYDGDGHVLSALAGSDVRGGTYHLRRNDVDYSFAGLDDNNRRHMSAEQIHCADYTLQKADGSDIAFAYYDQTYGKRMVYADEITATDGVYCQYLNGYEYENVWDEALGRFVLAVKQ